VLLCALTLLGCRGRGTKATTPDGEAAPPPAVEASAGPRGDRSIYALSMTLTDQEGAHVGLDVFRGKPTFIGMFYGTCPSACPLLISTIKHVMAGLDSAADAEVRVLLVSFDPARDTPEALRKIVALRGLDTRWKLASAPEDQVRDLAAVLGIQYRQLPGGNFTHTSSVILLDRSGAIDMRLDDTAQPIEPLVARAKAIVLTAPRARATPRSER
jgi:protein SCO1/2